MSKTVKAMVALSLVAFVAACAQQEEEVVYVPPVEVEAPTGKY